MIEMPCVRLIQGGAELFIGFLPAREIVDLMIVDKWHREEGWNLQVQGYQSQIYEDHISGIQQFLTRFSDELLPTGIVGAIRDEHRPLVTFADADGVHSKLRFQEGSHLYIVDGQHRLIAPVLLAA